MTETTPVKMDMPDGEEIRALSNLIKHSLRMEAPRTHDVDADADAALAVIMPRTITILETALRHLELSHDADWTPKATEAPTDHDGEDWDPSDYERAAATLESQWLASLMLSRASLYENPREFLEHTFRGVLMALPHMLKARADEE